MYRHEDIDIPRDFRRASRRSVKAFCSRSLAAVCCSSSVRRETRLSCEGSSLVRRSSKGFGTFSSPDCPELGDGIEISTNMSSCNLFLGESGGFVLLGLPFRKVWWGGICLGGDGGMAGLRIDRTFGNRSDYQVSLRKVGEEMRHANALPFADCPCLLSRCPSHQVLNFCFWSFSDQTVQHQFSPSNLSWDCRFGYLSPLTEHARWTFEIASVHWDPLGFVSSTSLLFATCYFIDLLYCRQVYVTVSTLVIKEIV